LVLMLTLAYPRQFRADSADTGFGFCQTDRDRIDLRTFNFADLDALVITDAPQGILI
jgi:hypothetical protein